jgi:2-keto-4-pentenoate hydratase/2-oxohepta-3-ene-1,7-dioic acid hydratase in catechol pathway
MLVKRVSKIAGGEQAYAINKNNTWHILEKKHTDILEVLEELPLLQSGENVSLKTFNSEEYKDIIPFKPASFRDFMLYEKHAIDAARGFVKKYLSQAYPVVRFYEKITGKTFPMLKPSKRYYKYPIYYLGNHLNFFSDGDQIHIPAYTKQLDYELEIAAIITKPLKNATTEDVNNAIGGFVILNDFSARDQQMDEMKSGFGPMKTKNFANAISVTVASKESMLSRLDNLNVAVYINEQLVVKSTSANKKYSIQEAIAYASWEEQLHPGELFGSGTIPGCTGIENGVMLKKGDIIRLEVEGIGSLTNYIV